jgi:8-amino-7-oxononanoate synthase
VDSLEAQITRELLLREKSYSRRVRVAMKPVDSTHVEIEGRRYVNFASNDYLGLTHHPKVRSAVESAVHQYGYGSGAASLITGYTPEHARAEAEIAHWKGTESAVLLPSGYQTAHAAIQAISGVTQSYSGGVRFLLDKLVHASLIDAVMASNIPFRIYPHNHLEKLARLLGDASREQLDIVITESIFSMDGDSCDLRGIAELKRRRSFFLLLDEAHASGVYGEDGAGFAAEKGLQSVVDASIVTFSKAFGAAGGAICGTSLFCEAIVNWGRGYIYSTAIPAAQAATVRAGLDVLRTEPDRRKRLRDLAQIIRRRLASAGIEIPAGDSPIIPIIIGNARQALQSAEELRNQGILVLAIRPPTVPPETSRLRATLSCDHTDGEINGLIDAIQRTCNRMSVTGAVNP